MKRKNRKNLVRIIALRQWARSVWILVGKRSFLFKFLSRTYFRARLLSLRLFSLWC